MALTDCKGWGYYSCLPPVLITLLLWISDFKLKNYYGCQSNPISRTAGGLFARDASDYLFLFAKAVVCGQLL